MTGNEPSLEPSSTKTISYGLPNAASASSISATSGSRLSASLYTGITSERRPSISAHKDITSRVATKAARDDGERRAPLSAVLSPVQTMRSESSAGELAARSRARRCRRRLQRTPRARAGRSPASPGRLDECTGGNAAPGNGERTSRRARLSSRSAPAAHARPRRTLAGERPLGSMEAMLMSRKIWLVLAISALVAVSFAASVIAAGSRPRTASSTSLAASTTSTRSRETPEASATRSTRLGRSSAPSRAASAWATAPGT